MAMPRARSLFHRAIAQSVPGPFFSVALAKDVAETLAGGIGPRPTVADLAGVDPRKLAEAGAALGPGCVSTSTAGPVACTPTAFSPADDGALGACHGLDVPLTFGVYGGIGEMLIGPTPSPEAGALSARFRSAWTAFATTGDPGWPAYNSGQRRVQLFDTAPTVATYPEEASRRLWERHVFAPLPLVTP